jgi:hypothetical protein
MQCHEIEPRSDAGARQKGGDVPSVRLLTLADLDGRTRAAREAEEFVDALIQDQGGDVPVAVRQIAEGAAMLRQLRRHIWVCAQLGAPVEPAVLAMVTSLATVCNTERRQLETIGTDRKPRDISDPNAAHFDRIKRIRATLDSVSSAPATVEPPDQENRTGDGPVGSAP